MIVPDQSEANDPLYTALSSVEALLKKNHHFVNAYAVDVVGSNRYGQVAFGDSRMGRTQTSYHSLYIVNCSSMKGELFVPFRYPEDLDFDHLGSQVTAKIAEIFGRGALNLTIAPSAESVFRENGLGQIIFTPPPKLDESFLEKLAHFFTWLDDFVWPTGEASTNSSSTIPAENGQGHGPVPTLVERFRKILQGTKPLF